jgi:hypothetical protein
VMRVGSPGVHKVSKSEALNLLTVGVPTLAINYSGRRQVFVESPLDAEIYEDLFQILKSQLPAERSLQFIGVGRKNPVTGTHEQTGSSIVESLILQFSNSGNLSIFGLLDWDTKNVPSGRLRVVARNERYTLENSILDPLAIGALICRHSAARKHLPSIGLNVNTTYPELINFNSMQLQQLADGVSAFLFGSDPTASALKCEYVGGFELNVRQNHLGTNGHALEDLVLEKIPEFKYFKGKLKQEIVSTIFSDKKEFIPQVLLEAFTEILNAQTHT